MKPQAGQDLFGDMGNVNQVNSNNFNFITGPLGPLKTPVNRRIPLNSFFHGNDEMPTLGSIDSDDSRENTMADEASDIIISTENNIYQTTFCWSGDCSYEYSSLLLSSSPD